MIKSEDIIKSLHSFLKLVQQEMFKSFYSSSQRKYVIHSSRRLGKTYFLCVISAMTCFHKPNAQVRYASSTQKSVRKMIHPIFKEIFSKFPAPIRPQWNQQEGAYIFVNGSTLHVAGVNNGHADDLRGTAADLAVIDEAAFIDELSYVVDSVLMPQLLTTGGRLIMASSSPLSPAHEFTSYIQEARAQGSYSSFDIYQGGYHPDIVEEFKKEAGGELSTTWRREYLNELIVDDTYSIIPEWKKDYVESVPRPDYFKFLHKYRAMDIGVRDKTAVIWAYYDFPNAKLVIEDMFSISGADTTTRRIADEIKLKDAALAYDKVYRGIADNNNLLLLQDLQTEFNISFAPTSKESLAAMVNELRLWVQNGRLTINPRCQELIQCLEFGVYQDEKRREFGRSKTLGHYDALAALIYLVRNIDQHTNPIPASFGLTASKHDIFIPQSNEEVKLEKDFKRIFNLD